MLIVAYCSPTNVRLEKQKRYIHWIQDVPDQRAIVRQYMKYEHEIRSPLNATQLVLRALQFSRSSPQGPSYLIAAREVLEQSLPALGHPHTPSKTPSQQVDRTTPLEPTGITPSASSYLAEVLLSATHPLIVTSYCGRTVEGFEALKHLANLLAIAVHENAPIYNNFPTTSFLHQGHQWNGGGQLAALREADVILVVDSDVPWIEAQSKPSSTARIFHLDSDPLKEETTLWYLPCEKRWKCDSGVALKQIADAIQSHEGFRSARTTELIERRTEHLKRRFQERQDKLSMLETVDSSNGQVTVPFFMARLRESLGDLRAIGLNESTTNLGNVADHFRHDQPLSLIGGGGGALGWYSGAAVGASLALRESSSSSSTTNAGCTEKHIIITFTGDGTWLFGVPSCAYWMAKKYNTPFLSIIWNNGGWASPKNASLRLHPELAKDHHTGSNNKGMHTLGDELYTSITPSPNFGKIAEGAGDAWWARVERRDEVDGICTEAVRMVMEERRCALVEVVLDRI